jgi:prephenate dehydratase
VVRIAYLGPEGTFTEAALTQITAAGLVPAHEPGQTQLLPIDSTPAALDAVRDGAADYACVPIENSIDGSVMPTLDSLAMGSPVQSNRAPAASCTCWLRPRPPPGGLTPGWMPNGIPCASSWNGAAGSSA